MRVYADVKDVGFGSVKPQNGLELLRALVEFVGPEAVIDAVQEVCEEPVSQTHAVFCVPCRRKMKVVKVGQEVLELTAVGGAPYKTMSGDILGCPVCGTQIVSRWSKVTRCEPGDFDEATDPFALAGVLVVV